MIVVMPFLFGACVVRKAVFSMIATKRMSALAGLSPTAQTFSQNIAQLKEESEKVRFHDLTFGVMLIVFPRNTSTKTGQSYSTKSQSRHATSSRNRTTCPSLRRIATRRSSRRWRPSRYEFMRVLGREFVFGIAGLSYRPNRSSTIVWELIAPRWSRERAEDER